MDELKKIIIDMIDKGGPITFANFMEAALYYPELGYYCGPKVKIGKKGDFYTATNVSELFGVTIAGKLSSILRDMGATSTNIIEIGAGTGQLAFDILSELRDENLFNQLTYFIIEKSPDFIRRQSEMLSDYKDKIIWTDTVALSKEPVEGVIIQNEVIDAFPVHKVVMSKEGLKEIFIDYDSKLKEIVGEVSNKKLLTYLKDYGSDIVEGQTAEINMAALDWVADMEKILKRGTIVTIDYGGEASEIYSQSRMHGTISYYYQHELIEGPFEHLGAEDMTSHVNFSALMKKGEEVGFRTTSMESLAKFLMRNGLIERVEKIQNSNVSDILKLKTRLGIKNLIMPQAMGDRFKVLIQEKNLDKS